MARISVVCVEPTFSHWGSSEPFGLKQMASSSHSTYVEPISKDAESPGPEGDDPVRRCDEYMAALDDALCIPAKDLFSSFVAWSNRTFLGIVAFGGGPSYTKGCVLWKYFGFHQILLLNVLFSFAPPLICRWVLVYYGSNCSCARFCSYDADNSNCGSKNFSLEISSSSH